MLIVHHLNNSRSQRVLWALEELGLPHELVRYERQPNMLAPAALKKVHPLGKSPVIEDNGLILAESGAILEYLEENYDPDNRLRPQTPGEKLACRFWLHYAEGSLMPLLMIKLVLTQLGKAPVPWLLRPVGKALGLGVQKGWLNKQLVTHADFIESHLAQSPWFAGEHLSIADIQMSYPIMALLARGGLRDLEHTQAWFQRVQNRPAYQRALEQGGPVDIPGS